MGKTQPDSKDYIYTGQYDKAVFQKNYTNEFKAVPKFNLASINDLIFVLGKIGADSRIIDLRWAAYMLATVYVESSHTVRIKKISQSNGKSVVGFSKAWRNFTPIDEAGHGKGLKYYLPVKVRRLPDGNAMVTEYDGDQWTVSAITGDGRALRSGQNLGAGATIKPSSLYELDMGDDHQYYGRGYVQLTFWANYAAAGAALGRGLAFLFDPEQVNVPDTAYAILAAGLVNGSIFAHGRKLSQFFQGGHTDYVGARNMVNPGAKQANKEEVAKIAERFEAVLFSCKSTPEVAKR